MDLNSVDLPSHTIASLYSHSLVQLGEETTDTSIPVPIVSVSRSSELRILGENRQQVLIVVDYTDAVFIPDEELGFLTTMLGACKLSLADVAIFNRQSKVSADYGDLIAAFKPKVVFLFGIEPPAISLPVDFPQFQVQSFSNVTYLSSASLDQVRSDGLLKSKLWVCLRRIFNI